jgi:CBS domain-containing protein
MLTRPRVAKVGQTTVEAGRLMAEVGAGVLPVVDEDGRVVGIVTDRDICCALTETDRRPSAVPVTEVMHYPVQSCASTDDILAALHTMQRYKVRRLPVVEEGGRLEGLLTLDDVVMATEVFETGEHRGPYYTDIVETLQEIVRHSMPARVGAGTLS